MPIRYCPPLCYESEKNSAGNYALIKFFSVFYNPKHKDRTTQQLVKMAGFCERESLHIPNELAFTDIIFHMRELCINLGWDILKVILSNLAMTGSYLV